ncbi:MAG TPA: glycine oxidase ThiO [Candidatus Acidoferrales bacterium]|nr:glycine oxidase ThiO [Candidatus Acidoferrales bacterium]
MVPDVVIVGAGVIGGGIACELTRHGMSVLLLDRQKPAAEATWAAAGMLAPSPNGPDSIALVPLARASLDLYPAFVDAVEADSGIRVGFRRHGSLAVFFGAGATGERDRYLAGLLALGLGGEPLDAEELRRREPRLNPGVGAGVWLAQEASVDNRVLGRALAVAAERQGTELRCGVEVTGLAVEGHRCLGVQTSSGKIAAGHVVIAAGCYSSRIETAMRYAPTQPVRGQMVALDAGAALPASSLRMGASHGYIVPRGDGRVVAGSTLEDAGFDKSVTPGGVGKILAAAVVLAPALERAPILEVWSGLRPDTPDHLPVLGPTDIPGLSIATGHYRNGILLAPITARLARQWLLGQQTDMDLAAFSPMRFGESGER